MMKEVFYRVVVDGVGVYAAVDRDCPEGDSRRTAKPDGAWLPKEGTEYPGAVSFWTEYGWKKYKNSGLMDWHTSVVKGNVEILKMGRPPDLLYEDEYQIIVTPGAVQQIQNLHQD